MTHTRGGAGRPVSPRAFYLLTNAWGVGIALLALFACASYFLLPENLSGASRAVEAQIGGWATLYYATYGVAGASILVGLVRRNDPLDAFGLALFIGGLCVNLAALVATLGPLQTIPALGAWLAYVIGATGRLLVVARLVCERQEPEPVPIDVLVKLTVDP